MSILILFAVMSPFISLLYLSMIKAWNETKDEGLMILLSLVMIILIITPFVASHDNTDKSNFEFYFIDGNSFSELNG